MKFYNIKYLFIAVSILVMVICVLLIFINNQSKSKVNHSNNTIENTKNLNFVNIKINNLDLNLKIANDENERRQGLSDVISMQNNEGMLFVFSDEQIRNFWMKDMNFDLDIIYLNQNKEIVSIYKNVSKSTYDRKNPNKSVLINSIYPAEYVIELNANMLDIYNLKLGDKINF